MPTTSARADAKAPSDEAAINDQPAISGFLVGVGYARGLNERSNPGNIARVPRRQIETAIVLDVKHEVLDARMRAENMALLLPADGHRDHWNNEQRIQLLGFRSQLWSYGSTTLTLGKLNESFDEGMHYHPIDFFEDNFQAVDFDDKRGRGDGFPMLVLAHTTPTWTTRLFYSDDTLTDSQYRYWASNPGYNRGYRQLAAAWRCSLSELTVNLVAQKYLPGDVGLGGSFSYVIGANAELHGAWFAQRGSRLPVHRNVWIDKGSGFDVSDVYVSETPVKLWRLDDGRLYRRWLIGGSWTSESLFSLTVEWSHDDRGMNASERATWQAVNRFHQGLADPLVRDVNIAYDLQALRVRGRDQLFFKLALPVSDNWNVSLSPLVARDRSVAWSTRAAWQPDKHLEAWGDLWVRTGRAGTEFGATPERSGLSVGARVFF